MITKLSIFTIALVTLFSCGLNEESPNSEGVTITDYSAFIFSFVNKGNVDLLYSGNSNHFALEGFQFYFIEDDSTILIRIQGDYSRDSTQLGRILLGSGKPEGQKTYYLHLSSADTDTITVDWERAKEKYEAFITEHDLFYNGKLYHYKSPNSIVIIK